MPTAFDLAYFDASALVKLVIAEPESEALRHATRAWRRRATSRLAVVELIRAVRRADPRLELRATQALARVDLVADGDRILAAAAHVEPADLRAVDAIHIATAVTLRTVLGAFVSYDRRQLAAATAAGLPVLSPR